MDPLRLAYSPCPNDTFIFHAWVQGLLPAAPPVEERLEDIDTLNRLASLGEVDVVKVSFYAFGHLRERYALLHSGGALGRGCGPLIVARKDSPLRPADSAGGVALLADDLSRVQVAIPGELTTAALLSGLFTGTRRQRVVMPFDRIMPAVAAGEVEAGVIIHEGRFTFGSYGLRRLVDLGRMVGIDDRPSHPAGRHRRLPGIADRGAAASGESRLRERVLRPGPPRRRLATTWPLILRRWTRSCARPTSTST